MSFRDNPIHATQDMGTRSVSSFLIKSSSGNHANVTNCQVGYILLARSIVPILSNRLSIPDPNHPKRVFLLRLSNHKYVLHASIHLQRSMGFCISPLAKIKPSNQGFFVWHTRASLTCSLRYRIPGYQLLS